MLYSRFAIYYVPPEGPLADFGAKWLGWDVVTGRKVPHFNVPGLHDITMTPRKYGFHGTLKPPFKLKEGQTFDALEIEASNMAATLAPAVCDGMKLTSLGRFLALTPFGMLDSLQLIAEACVRDLDEFRASAGEEELARRHEAGLSPRQKAMLAQWGTLPPSSTSSHTIGPRKDGRSTSFRTSCSSTCNIFCTCGARPYSLNHRPAKALSQPTDSDVPSSGGTGSSA